VDQTIINWLFAGFGATLGWLMKVIWSAIQELKADVKQISRDLPEIYVRKDDFRSAMSEIKEDMRELKDDMKSGFSKMDTTLGLMFKKLDSKEDKE
jgi:F0F1-type ATP synthase membrane subunit b/b'